MKKREYFFTGPTNQKLISEVRRYFINKLTKIIKDSHKWNSESRVYSETFSGTVMDKFYFYTKIMIEAITTHNLIGITVSLAIGMFTVYASKSNLVFLKLSQKNFEESYLTNFTDML